jgi:hypothetical protein
MAAMELATSTINKCGFAVLHIMRTQFCSKAGRMSTALFMVISSISRQRMVTNSD